MEIDVRKMKEIGRGMHPCAGAPDDAWQAGSLTTHPSQLTTDD